VATPDSTLPIIVRKLLGILVIKYKLYNKTGLLIRSPLAKASIGGTDTEPMITKKKYLLKTSNNKMVTEIIVDVPYIPGSSLKGRMRSLLEQYEGSELYFDGKIYMHVRDFSPNKNACKDPDHALDNLFGSPSIQLQRIPQDKANEIASKIAPTRLIVEDIYPSTEFVSKLYSMKGIVSKEDFLEEKSENRIDRITSAADPRFIVRVRPDIEFEGEFKILIFDIDFEENAKKLKEYLDLLFTGMKLVEDTYLGGSGTRGYGKVEFKDIEIILRPNSYYLGIVPEIEIGKLPNTATYNEKRGELFSRIISNLSK